MSKGYGFLHGDMMPHGEFNEIIINGLEDMDWAVTGSYFEMAKNHCASVCLTNLYKIYKAQGLDCTLDGNDEIFRRAYGFTGNGPIIALGRKAKKFIKSLGYGFKIKKHKNITEISESIKNNEPVAVLVTGGLFLWHWIICVGVRTYADGTKYLRIMDNWNRNTNRYLKVKKHFTWFRALKFVEIKKLMN